MSQKRAFEDQECNSEEFAVSDVDDLLDDDDDEDLEELENLDHVRNLGDGLHDQCPQPSKSPRRKLFLRKSLQNRKQVNL